MWLLFFAPFPILAVGAFIEDFVLKRAHGLWIAAVGLTFFSGYFFALFKTAKLGLTGHTVNYRSLFFNIDIDTSKIENVKFEFGAKPAQPIQRIVFETAFGPVAINAGPFNRKRCRKWVSTLNARLASNS